MNHTLAALLILPLLVILLIMLAYDIGIWLRSKAPLKTNISQNTLRLRRKSKIVILTIEIQKTGSDRCILQGSVTIPQFNLSVKFFERNIKATYGGIEKALTTIFQTCTQALSTQESVKLAEACVAQLKKYFDMSGVPI